MKNKLLFLIVLVSFVMASCAEKIQLFDLDNPDSWMEMGDAKWEFEHGVISGSVATGTGFLITQDTYANFELQLDFYPDETINSGVFIRCKEQALSYTDCYEINIWDNHPKQVDRTGAIVSRTKPLPQVNTTNQWNTYRIKCKGNEIKAWINDVLLADIQNSDLAEGFIALQADGIGMVKFRNVTLKKL